MFEIINTQRENPVKKCTNTFIDKILETTENTAFIEARL